MKGSEQQGTLVHYSLFLEKREKHKFWLFSKYVDFFVVAKMNKICLKIVNSGNFATDALSEKHLI